MKKLVKRKSPLEPSAGPRKRAYELDGMTTLNMPQDPMRQIENEALRDLSNEYRALRIEEMIAKKRKQLGASGPASSIQMQRENLEYFKTVMELAKMNQPKDQPDRTLEYLRFFDTVTKNQGAPANFFDQYIKGRELGIFGQPSTGDSNTSDVEIERLRGERMLDSKRIDLELHKLRLEQQLGADRLSMFAQVLGPVLAVGGDQLAQSMRKTGSETGARVNNPFNPASQTLQGETGKLEIQCDCGFNEALLVPVPPPATVACPQCGKTLETGPPPISDSETESQWGNNK